MIVRLAVKACFHVVFWPIRATLRRSDRAYIDTLARIEEANLDACYREIEMRHGRHGANRAVELILIRDFTRPLTSAEVQELALLESGSNEIRRAA